MISKDGCSSQSIVQPHHQLGRADTQVLIRKTKAKTIVKYFDAIKKFAEE